MRYRLWIFPSQDGVQLGLRPVPPDGREPGLPLFVARWLEESLRRSPGVWPGVACRWLQRWRRMAQRRHLERALAWLGYAGLERWVDRVSRPVSAEKRAQGLGEELGWALAGRVWLEQELARWARRHGHPVGEAILAAEAMAAAGQAQRWAAVELEGQRLVCRRCGQSDGVVVQPCPRCGSLRCPRCLRCARMGMATGCSALFAMPWRGLRQAGLKLPQLPVALGPAQRELALQLVGELGRHWERVDGEAGEGPAGCVIWAVTGAGKTEVALTAVARAMEEGLPVAFAVPRRDVAADVARRAAGWFGEERVELVVGRGQGEPVGGQAAGPGEAPVGEKLVVTTTHQLLRFYRAFALLVLDEADAFPLRGDGMLEYATTRALGPKGFMVVMSATPGPRWLERARVRGWPVLRLSARHHGHPLPVPELWVDRAMADWQKAPERAERVPPYIRQWLHRRLPGVRVLVFAPTLRLVEGVARALGVPFCHSAHPGRQRVIQAFGEGRIPVLVTSTVLERGLTFAAVDVLVVFADCEAVFDEAALVQMAGRCGRHAAAPGGRVLFAAARRTRSMQAAVEHIRSMNRHAQAAGFLRESPRGQRAEVV